LGGEIGGETDIVVVAVVVRGGTLSQKPSTFTFICAQGNTLLKSATSHTASSASCSTKRTRFGRFFSVDSIDQVDDGTPLARRRRHA